MTEEIFMSQIKPQRITVDVRLRPSYSKKEKQKMGNVYLQVIIDRKSLRLPLAMTWPMDRFDEETGKLLPRFPDDQVCYDYNLDIAKYVARANEVRLWFRMKEVGQASVSEFRRLFSNPTAKGNFVKFCEGLIPKLMETNRAKPQTVKNYYTWLERVKEFIRVKKDNEPLHFFHLNANLILEFKGYYQRKGQKHNTITGWIKIFKKFCREAQAQEISFDEGILKAKSKYVPGSRPALTQEDVQILTNHCFSEGIFTEHELEVLKKFTFSCYTGLRISDSNQLHSKHINKGVLNMSLVKGEDFGKQITMQVPQPALDIIKGRKGLIFKPMVDSLVNKTLKKIFEKLEIDTHVSFHVARHTFCTIYLELGGDLLSLKELAGHSSISITEQYLRSREKNKKLGMENFNKFQKN